MVKMAYAPLPKLVPIDMSNVCPNNVTKTTLSEILQSDPVKRLFSQPNLVIRTVPLTVTKNPIFGKDIFGNRKNGMNISMNNIRPPEISIVPVRTPEEEREDSNLLPSKIEDKKSEIAITPVKQKLCGHYEPCENIICDVSVQQYIDQDGVSPMLAVNIEEDEINAPVSKHCKNKYCDALSIDHNRCRRALIKLHKCDKSHMCDICSTNVKGWKSRIYHRNCTRRDEYRHNNVDRVHILKERMRERELQMIEAAKTKKNDYLDPIKGYNLAMETLRKNEELIIIPKTVPSQKPIITITSVTSTQSSGNNLSVAQPININSQANNPTSIFGKMRFALSTRNTMSGNAPRSKESKVQTVKQVKFPYLQQNSYITPTSTSVTSPVTAPITSAPLISTQNQYIHLTTASQTNIQPITVNNWVVSPSQVITTTPIQPKPFLTPIRVVPITNLITAPSLLHRTQGIPKFCIMADNLVTPLTIPNPPPLQPARPSAAVNVTPRSERLKVAIPRRRKLLKKFLKRPKKKTFFCVYCSKHFSTDWYFKMHVAKHKGEKLFSCTLCNESFSNRYDMKKHMNKKHNDEEKLVGETCNYVCTSPNSIKNDIKIHSPLTSDKANVKVERWEADTKICASLCKEFTVDKIKHHLINHSDEEKTKKLMCDDITNNLNEGKETSINGKMERHAASLKSTCIEDNDNTRLSTVNGDNNIKTNGFTSVSTEGNTGHGNLDQETIFTAR